MLFDSSIRKELARSFGATLLVLVTVVMTMMLIRMLGQASKGVISPSDVLLVMGLTVVGYLPIILTLSLFIAMVGTLSRMYRDSEMAIWMSSGLGLGSVLRPFLRFSWPILAAVAGLALLAWPWSNQQVLQLRAQFEQRSDLDRIAPGEFQESSDGSRVFFIDKDSISQDAARNVFVVENRQNRQFVTSAQSARVEHEGERRFVVLHNGQRVETDFQSGQTKLTQFDTYRVLLNSGGDAVAEYSTRAIPSWDLLRASEPVHRAELGWRLSLPLQGVALIFLALAITRVNPRVGKSSGLLLALLVFVVYYNLLNTGQSWVAAGRMGMVGFLLALHGSALMLGVGGLLLRHHQCNPLQLLQRLRKASA
jgi:lipopolysaccharide export system permease protein